MCQQIGCCRGSRTFVCLDCMTSARGLDSSPLHSLKRKYTNKTLHPRCPKCRQPMKDLGFMAIPRRAHWKKLRKELGSVV